MAPENQATLLQIPAEIRLIIYGLLLDDGGESSLEIRSESIERYQRRKPHRRTSYRVLGGGMVRQTLKTTYYLASSAQLHTNILAVNRKIHGEASPLIYSKHSFDFGKDIEAVVPFLSDLTPRNRRLIHKISLTKQGSVFCREFDRWEWSTLCTFIEENMKIRKLRLRVMGGKPLGDLKTPDAVQEYTISDFRALASVGYSGLEWVRELKRIRTLDELEIIPIVVSCPPLSSFDNLAFYAAFSRSIDKGFQEYLRAEMLPAR